MIIVMHATNNGVNGICSVYDLCVTMCLTRMRRQLPCGILS